MARLRALVAALVLGGVLVTAAPDPARAAPVGRLETQLSNVQDAVFADGAVWLLTADGQLGRFTAPDVLEIVPLPGLDEGTRMTVAPNGRIWITSFSSDRIARFNPATRAFASFPLPGVDGPFGVVPAAGSIWVAGFLNDTLGRVNPTTGAVTFTAPAGVNDPDEIEVAGGDLWYLGGDLTFGRHTIAGGATQTFAHIGLTGMTDIAAAADGSLWISDAGGDRLGRVDRVTGAITQVPTTGVDGPSRFAVTDVGLVVTGVNNDTVGRVNTAGPSVTSAALPGIDAPRVAAQLDGASFAIVSGTGDGDTATIGYTTGTTIATTPANAIDLPHGVVAGPDGNIWVNAFADDRVVRLDRDDGGATPVPLPGIDGAHESIVGPDGNIWVTGRNSDTIARLDPVTLEVDVFPTTGVDNPRGMAVGSDGNLWVVGRSNDTVGRVVPSTGVTTAFPTTGMDSPRHITAGPDGNLYLTGSGNGTIGTVVPATGAVSVINDTIGGTLGITTGADGKLWVTTSGTSDQILRLGLDGTLEDSVTLDPESGLVNIVTGPDGNVWVAAQSTDRLIRVTPFMGLTSFSTTGLVDGPFDLAFDPGNVVWVGGELDDGVATIETFAPHGFSDVGPAAAFDAGLDWARSFALVSGFADGTYRPRSSVLRGQVVNMLWNLMDQPGGAPPHGFVDVPANAFFREGLNWAKAEGLVSGFAGNRYRPNNPVTRGQLVNMLWNMVGTPGGNPGHRFDDVPDGAFYDEALDWAKRRGLVSGFPGNLFKPNDPVTRGQVASILYNLARNPSAWMSSPVLPSTLLFEALN
jgi:streptogramin lyase